MFVKQCSNANYPNIGWYYFLRMDVWYKLINVLAECGQLGCFEDKKCMLSVHYVTDGGTLL